MKLYRRHLVKLFLTSSALPASPFFVLAFDYPALAKATTNLKPFDPVALQGSVEAMAKELLLPGVMVLLRTPRGEFIFGYGATVLGGAIPPRADTHFRIASNTKTMTAAVIVQLVQEGKLRFDDAISKYVEGVPKWGQHHDQ